MSNLSQFFAAGGNKIKKIQRVQASQTVSGFTYYWPGSATISAVNVNKTILVYNITASNSFVYTNQQSYASHYIQYNHYPFLDSSTSISFNGPSIPTGAGSFVIPAQLEVQIIEFE